MSKVIICVVAGLLFCMSLIAQTGNPAWRVSLNPDTKAPTTITAQNRCKKRHSFDIKLENITFLELGSTTIEVDGGKNKTVPVIFNTTGLTPGTYEGNVFVVCVDCKNEPTCTQDRETLPVVLTVKGGNGRTGTDPVNAGREPKNPCDIVEDKCADLQRVANDKEAAAAGAEGAAATARSQASAAEQAAKDAKTAADNAAELAKPPTGTGGGSITSDGETFTTADEKWLADKRAKLQAQYQAGGMTSQQYQQRVRNLMGREALRQAQKERLANIARLKREAEEAKQKADKAAATAQGAKSAAEAAEETAKKARAAADAARKAYEDCVKKAAEECREWKRLQEEARKSAEAAERARTQAENRRKQEEANKRRERARTEYLLTMIQRLNLIDSSAIAKVPSIWQWMPDLLEAPGGAFFEGLAQNPIPTDTLKALGEVYGVFAKMMDPCYGLGMSKTVERLKATMIDPKTGRLYEHGAAVSLADEMCRLMRKMKSRLEALHREQQKRG